MLKDLILQLLEDLEMESTELREDEGLFYVEVIENINVLFRNLEPKGICMTTSLGACPELQLDELFTKIMSGNLFGQETGDAIISLDEKKNVLKISLELPDMPSHQEFYAHVESFLNHVELWQNVIASHRKNAERRSGDVLY